MHWLARLSPAELDLFTPGALYMLNVLVCLLSSLKSCTGRRIVSLNFLQVQYMYYYYSSRNFYCTVELYLNSTVL